MTRRFWKTLATFAILSVGEHSPQPQAFEEDREAMADHSPYEEALPFG